MKKLIALCVLLSFLLVGCDAPEPVGQDGIKEYLSGYDNMIQEYGIEGEYTIESRQTDLKEKTDHMLVQFDGSNETMNYQASYDVQCIYEEKTWKITSFDVLSSKYLGKTEVLNQKDCETYLVDNGLSDITIQDTITADNEITFVYQATKKSTYVETTYNFSFPYQYSLNRGWELGEITKEKTKKISKLTGKFVNSTVLSQTNSKEALPYLELNKDFTYTFVENCYSYYLTYTGTYTISDGVVTLKNPIGVDSFGESVEGFYLFNKGGKDEISFSILSKSKLKSKQTLNMTEKGNTFKK